MPLPLSVGASHQTGPPGQGHEDQVPGGDLPVLSAHQGMQYARMLCVTELLSL